MHRTSRAGLVGLRVVALLAGALAVAVIAGCGTSAHGRARASSSRAAAGDAGASSHVAGASAHVAGASSLTVGTRATGRSIPAGFLGLSLEFSAIEPYAGTNPSALNPVFVQLARNLSPGQSPVLRIGGDTTDWTWWPVPGMAKPPGVRISLNPTWAHVTAALAQALGAHLILGVDLEADSTKVAAYEARRFIQGIGAGAIAGLEPGNEPELYGSFGWYRNAQGVEVPGRPKGYDYAAFKGDFSRFAAALPRQIPLAGPATGAPKWMPELANFLAAQPRVRIATLHRYPVQQCFIKPSSPQYPTVAHLLAPYASRDMANTVARYVGVSRARHVSLRIDEMNTVSCGTAPGVSNAFVSALWALDATFQMARVGVDGVNIHSYPKAPYELFTFKRSGGRWVGQVAPEYYGLLMFAQAAPPGSRLLRLSGSLGNVRAWATRATDGTTHVVLINEYTAHAKTVAVRVPGTHGSATLERLRAPGIQSTSGVTIGGQSFGSRTSTGRLAGRSRVTTINRTAGGFVVHVPPASAAMLTIGAPPPA